MATVDLNADLAEGDRLTPGDLGVLDAVTSASLACGFHAGGPAVMGDTASACVDRGVAIGAHVSFRDREGFGRRTMSVPPQQLVADLMDQWTILATAVSAVGGTVSFVKPHGALYHQMGTDPSVADAVVAFVVGVGRVPLVAQADTVVSRRAGEAGVRVVAEGFPDRGYRRDGRLAPRAAAGALVHDPDEVGRRAVSLVQRGGVEAVDGTWTAVEAETLCIHGDAEGAATTASTVRAALEGHGVVLRSFVVSGAAGARGASRP
jgi:5-oxoprolinase (ATP-hydrolysing) subunit A